MNKAFVKGADEESVDDLPDRLISPHPNLVTPEGLAAIEAEMARWDAARDAALAADDKDALARAHREQRYWAARRTSAHVTEPPADAAEVHFGAKVTIARKDGRRQTFRIVGEDEAEPSKGTISHVSPLALSLLGKAVGDTAEAGDATVEIVAIA
ncbi:MAG: transcription elongation factor GreA [Alphaproteobacteria bacterium]|nr:transcription elongation factor GreA [Alphaproteobacteria bacterium]